MLRTFLLLAFAACAVAAFADEPAKPAPETLADILSPAEIASIDRQRAAGPPGPGISYAFHFKDVPGYGNVDVHYLIEDVTEGGKKVRRLAANPSAVVYLVAAKRYSEIRRHLSEAEFAEVLEQFLAIEKSGETVLGVTIRRGIFDPGNVPVDQFLKERAALYDSMKGVPHFDAWPAAWRSPCGKLSASVVDTEITRSSEKSPAAKVIQAKQFFGYLFPVLDDILKPEQKEQIAAELKQSNIRDGAASVRVPAVGEYGDVEIVYLMREGKPLERPTAMVSRVRLMAADIAKDPMVIRKYLAPEGANYLEAQIRKGEKAGQKLEYVEITRVLVDIVTKGTPDAERDYNEFNRDLSSYVRQDQVIRAESWPERFRKPDGTFDIELASTSVAWKVTK